MAVALADAGRRVLLVSTDPASNLSDVFEMTTGEHPIAVPGVPRLEIMDLDPHEAADDYRARVVGPYRGVLPDAEVAALEEKLAGACTVEVAAFDAFARLLATPTVLGRYDHVVFDTAPTGHTLRLLSLPAAWSDYLGANPDATSCLGPLAGLQDDRPIYAAPSTRSRIRRRRPSCWSYVQTEAPSQSLQPPHRAACARHRAPHTCRQRRAHRASGGRRRGQRLCLGATPGASRAGLRRWPSTALLRALEPDRHGRRRALRADSERHRRSHPRLVDAGLGLRTTAGTLSDLVDEIEGAGRGAVLVTGKGGVGKTTVAGLIAVELARRGRPVHLSTTDPAGHAAAPIEPCRP